jgi:hypothetical protein
VNIIYFIVFIADCQGFHEVESGGRDYRTGMKLPQYMQELGLEEIQIRVNDRVKFANPYAEDYDAVYRSIVRGNG